MSHQSSFLLLSIWVFNSGQRLWHRQASSQGADMAKQDSCGGDAQPWSCHSGWWGSFRDADVAGEGGRLRGSSGLSRELLADMQICSCATWRLQSWVWPLWMKSAADKLGASLFCSVHFHLQSKFSSVIRRRNLTNIPQRLAAMRCPAPSLSRPPTATALVRTAGNTLGDLQAHLLRITSVSFTPCTVQILAAAEPRQVLQIRSS